MNFLGHTSVNCFIAGGSSVALYQSGYFTPAEALWFTGAFVFATLMLGPDLDLYYSKVNKNWGVFRLLWWPYAKLSKHRGLSHTPILSSFIRIAYLAGAALILSAVLFLFFSNTSAYSFISDFNNTAYSDGLKYAGSNFLVYRAEIIAIVLGVIFSDLVHLMSDFLSSLKKKIS